jgi:hypothetical protein
LCEFDNILSQGFDISSSYQSGLRNNTTEDKIFQLIDLSRNIYKSGVQHPLQQPTDVNASFSMSLNTVNAQSAENPSDHEKGSRFYYLLAFILLLIMFYTYRYFGERV